MLLKIGLITDLHYGENTNYPTFGGEEYVNSFGEHIKIHRQQIIARLRDYDLIVNLGDLFADKHAELDRQAYQEALDLIESIGGQVIHAIGNHELLNLNRNELAKFIKQPRTYYSLDFGGFHHVILDPQRQTRQDPYFISDEQLTWLSNDLTATSLTSLAYIHFPLDDQNLDSNYYFRGQEDKALVKNRKDVRSVLEKSGKILAVFSGHLHFYKLQEINNIKYITVPSLTENNGSGKPSMQYISATLDNNSISFLVESMDLK